MNGEECEETPFHSRWCVAVTRIAVRTCSKSTCGRANGLGERHHALIASITILNEHPEHQLQHTP